MGQQFKGLWLGMVVVSVAGLALMEGGNGLVTKQVLPCGWPLLYRVILVLFL